MEGAQSSCQVAEGAQRGTKWLLGAWRGTQQGAQRVHRGPTEGGCSSVEPWVQSMNSYHNLSLPEVLAAALLMPLYRRLTRLQYW